MASSCLRWPAAGRPDQAGPMPEPSEHTTWTRTRRLVGGAFGVFFIAIAVAIVVTSTASTRVGAVAAAVVVGALGLDLVVSAGRRRRSWLSRIGPLP